MIDERVGLSLTDWGEASWDSPARLYRYSLVKGWNTARPRCCFVLLNPSTATAQETDATNRVCMGFARRWGYGSVEHVNLFALRSKDPADLYDADDPIGPENDDAILRAAERSGLIVCAWGNHGTYLMRDQAVLNLLDRWPLYHLGRTGGNQPRFPRAISRDTEPIQFASAKS